MKLTRKLGLVALPLAVAILAGCQTTSKAPEQAQPQQAQQQQAAPLAVFQASNKAVKGYRAVKLSEKQTIYVSTTPVFTREEVLGAEVVTDKQNHTFVALAVNPTAQKALASVPKTRGFVTVVGGQVASLAGVRQQDKVFLFNVANQQVAQSIIKAVWPQAAAHQPAPAPATK